MRTVTLRPGHAKPLWHGHPWVYARSVATMEDDVGDGPGADWVRVKDADGRVVGHGLLSAESAIRVRLLALGDPAGSLETLLCERIDRAAELRQRLFPNPETTNAYRLIHAEADGVPGLVVDRFADVLVAQFGTQPMLARREALAARLLKATGARTLVGRAGRFESEEGIEPGDPFHFGESAQDMIEIREGGTPLLADPLHGQKTGHYTDQRENRMAVAALSRGRDLLDLFAGSAGFSIQALRAGARSALAVDSGGRPVEAAVRNAALSGVTDRLRVERADVTEALAGLKGAERRFGVVVLDPPNLVPKRTTKKRALKTWREFIVRALTRVEDRGHLASFSCTPHVDGPQLLELMQSASRDCRRPFRVLRTLEAGPDHPVLPAAPMTRYLSGYLVEVCPW